MRWTPYFTSAARTTATRICGPCSTLGIGKATIPRCVGQSYDVRHFPVYAAVALAGLGDLPDTLMSRSVIIRMRRRAPGEHVEPFRHRKHAEEGDDLREALAEWATIVGGSIGEAWPTMPEGVTDRPADCWEPLLAVADAAGGHWPRTARAACTELVQVAVSREASLGVRLLADLRSIFVPADENGQPGEPHDLLSTEAVLTALHGLAEAPWGDLRGKPLGDRGLAAMLRRYGISSTKVRVGDKSLRGYRREHLWDAWQRYLPSTPVGAEPAEPPEPPSSAKPVRVPLPTPVPDRSGTPARSGTSGAPADLRGSAGSGSSAPAGGAACAACGDPLAYVEPGQPRTHANCDPAQRRTA